ncbi:hypothetical protein KC323_g293 [Hortaea werneckii]|nr:hypothetical protein KC323_g293 [Hortaea werneckii]
MNRLPTVILLLLHSMYYVCSELVPIRIGGRKFFSGELSRVLARGWRARAREESYSSTVKLSTDYSLHCLRNPDSHPLPIHPTGQRIIASPVAVPLTIRLDKRLSSAPLGSIDFRQLWGCREAPRHRHHRHRIDFQSLDSTVPLHA